MIKKGALFKLIKSLTKSEKRYFKLSLQSDKENKNYLALFDFIENQKKYDEATIKKHFAGKKFIKQLHVTKNYLSKLILRSLKNFHQKSSKDLILKSLLQDIEILFKKELYNQAVFDIEKAIKLAEKYEKFPALLDALNWKRKLIIAQQGAVNAKKELDEIIEKQSEVLKNMFNINEYYELTAHFYDYFQTSGQFNQTVYTSLSKNPLITNPDSAATFESKILFCNLLFAYHIYKDKNYSSAYQSLENLVNLLKRNPELIREEPTAYITAINDQIQILLYTKKHQDIPKLLKQIREAPQKFKFEQLKQGTLRAFLQTYLFELELYRDIGEPAKGLIYIDEITAILNKYQTPVTKSLETLFYYQFAYLNFLLHNYENAQNWLKLILKSKSHEQIETQINAHFLNMIIEYNYQHFPALNKLNQEAKEFIKQFHRPYPHQKILIAFFKQSAKKPSNQNLAELKNQLNLQENDHEFQDFQQKLNIPEWINSKL